MEIDLDFLEYFGRTSRVDEKISDSFVVIDESEPHDWYKHVKQQNNIWILLNGRHYEHKYISETFCV